MDRMAMMAKDKFSQNFWGADFCSTVGFDTLTKRLKEGKQMCVDFEEFIDKRHKIEKQYAEDTIRLARSISGKDEIGSLRRSWEKLRSELENTGRLHMQLAQRLSEDVLKSVKDFRNQQKDVRKKGEDTVRRAQNHKKSCFDKNNRLHNTYEGKCRDADKAQETLHKLETNPLSKPNQLQQAHRRLEAARAAGNNADLQYQEAVKVLEEARLLWEREMEMLCQKFQELEEQRIAFLRHQMWTVSNLYSQLCVDEDEAYESVRKSLENCDVDADIDEFIKDKSTGSERPAPVPYENYYNPRNKASLPGVPNVPTMTSAPNKELPPVPVEEPMDQGGDSTYSVPDLSSRVAPESHYSVPRGSERVIVLYDYDAQGPQELQLRENEVVTVIGKEDDVWWCGQIGERIGMFPAAYVEPYS